MKDREKEMEIGKREGMKDATDGKIGILFYLQTNVWTGERSTDEREGARPAGLGRAGRLR